MADGAIARPAVSYQDVLDAPDGQVAQIVNGVFYLQAQPAPPHNAVERGLLAALIPAFERGRGGPGGWWIIPEPELHFGNRDYRTLVPDLAGWCRDRLPEFPASWAELKVTPDWVCEILSPSTARLDRIEKMPVYAEQGIRHLWLIDPAAKTLEVFELTDGRWTMIAARGGDEAVSEAPFDAVPLVMGDLWLPGPEPEPGDPAQ